MRGTILPLPQYVFMAWCLVKHRDNFTFLPYVINSILMPVVNGKKRLNYAEICNYKGRIWKSSPLRNEVCLSAFSFTDVIIVPP
jgi:hypothetical protein